MTTIARAALLLALPTTLALVGCQSTPKKAPEPVVTMSPAESLAKVKADFGATGSDAKLASIVDVDEPSGWIALGDVNAADYPDGTLLSIVDADSNIVGYATVKQSKDGYVYAETHKGSGRMARVGDVAVRFPETEK